MPLPTTGNAGIDNLVERYNASEATGAIAALPKLLTDIENLATLWLGGRTGIHFRNAVAREKMALEAAQRAPRIAPLPLPTPPLPVPDAGPSSPGSLGVGMEQRWKLEDAGSSRLLKRQAARKNPLKYLQFASTFQRGKDLIYGLAMPRASYVEALDAQYPERSKADPQYLRIQPEDGMDFIIIDTFNNAFLGTEVLKSLPPFFIGRALTGTEAQDSERYLGELKGEHDQVRSFRTYLEKETLYDLQSISGATRAEQMMRYGRSCKTGMAYAILARKGRVHFLLDEIKMNLVLADRLKPKPERSISGKELRWLFRHRNHPQIRPEVVFWKDGKTTSAPWESEPKDWAEYGQEVLSRHSGSSTKIEKIKALTAKPGDIAS